MTHYQSVAKQFHVHDVETGWGRLRELLGTYHALAPVPLPASFDEAKAHLHQTMQEIEEFLREGRTPEYHEIPYRVAYMALCVCLAEQDRHHSHTPTQLRDVLEGMLTAALGLSLVAILDLAWHRYQRLCSGQEAEQVDIQVLVPLMIFHLRHTR